MKIVCQAIVYLLDLIGYFYDIFYYMTVGVVINL